MGSGGANNEFESPGGKGMNDSKGRGLIFNIGSKVGPEMLRSLSILILPSHVHTVAVTKISDVTTGKDCNEIPS